MNRIGVKQKIARNWKIMTKDEISRFIKKSDHADGWFPKLLINQDKRLSEASPKTNFAFFFEGDLQYVQKLKEEGKETLEHSVKEWIRTMVSIYFWYPAVQTDARKMDVFVENILRPKKLR